MKVSRFPDKHLMADHRLILHPFCHLATEDCVARSFQRLLTIDLSKDAQDCLVVHLRRLEDCMDDRFIRKHNVVGERLLEGTLRRTDGLRADSEWIQWIRPVLGTFGASKDGFRCGLFGTGGGAMESMVSEGIE